jgi:hypothetical protein
MSTHQMFKKINQEEWIVNANADLKGKVQAENIKYDIEEGLSFSPFITHHEVLQNQSISGPKTLAGVTIKAENEKIANQKAKEMLRNAAQVLTFDVSEETNFDQLFEGIFLDMITILLLAEDALRIRAIIDKYISANYQNIKTDVRIADQNNALQLSADLSFVERMAKTKAFIADKKDDQIIFVELKRDFLTQISELRAIRMLSLSQNSTIFIAAIANEDAYNNTEVHPMIIINYLLMSAYLGMSDAAFGIPYGDDGESARLSLNIHNVLKEESGFGFVTDPTAGAYIIEKITQQLFNAATT